MSTAAKADRLRIVLGNSSIARYPEAGGLWTLFLQYLLGLVDLGHDVTWLELLSPSGSEDRDRELVRGFFARMKVYGLDRRCVLLISSPGPDWSLDRAMIHGTTRARLESVCRGADIAWNFACALPPELLSGFRRRALIDLDPGHLQVSGLDWDLGFDQHEVLLTVGCNVGGTDCDVPTLGRRWVAFTPFVYLPMWRSEQYPGCDAPFTSVTQWGWGELWLDGRVLSTSKRDAYLRCLDLPARTGRAFVLAANIHEDEVEDRALLRKHRWNLVDPHQVAGSPEAYQAFVASSCAEICCPKPIFSDLRTGWISDRSACYLASGRPVVAGDTGFASQLPVGEGLLTFRDCDEAVNAVLEVSRRYPRHARAARGLAEDFFDSRAALTQMLSACWP